MKQKEEDPQKRIAKIAKVPHQIRCFLNPERIRGKFPRQEYCRIAYAEKSSLPITDYICLN